MVHAPDSGVFLCGPLDGANDSQMTAAAAQNTVQSPLDVRNRWVRVLVEQSLGRHDDPIHAKAALRRLLFDEGPL
jgi:hypothetical protein